HGRASGAGRDVADELAQEVDERLLAECVHLGRALVGQRPAEPLRARVASAHALVPVRFVPEDPVGAGLERRVRPRLHELAIPRPVDARGGEGPAVLDELAVLAVLRDEARVRLAAEGATYPPRAEL